MADLATTVRILRGQAGLTQRELADRAGVTWYVVSRIETGGVKRPLAGTIAGLAKALGVSPETLTSH